MQGRNEMNPSYDDPLATIFPPWLPKLAAAGYDLDRLPVREARTMRDGLRARGIVLLPPTRIKAGDDRSGARWPRPGGIQNPQG